MIPRIIHLVWFGKKAIPSQFMYYIETWKKYLPDYEVKIWDENSFDVNMIPFTKEAFIAKKWAFISDFVRLYALYTYGGWYFDTDVELVNSFYEFENQQVVLSTDSVGFIESAIIGAEPKHLFFKMMIDVYKNLHFKNIDGSYNTEVINTYLQDVLRQFGYVQNNQLQLLKNGIVIYPDDYFHVYNLVSGKVNRTSNTHSIHWHSLTWVSRKTRLFRFLRMKLFVPIMGEDRYMKFSKYLKSWLK